MATFEPKRTNRSMRTTDAPPGPPLKRGEDADGVCAPGWPGLERVSEAPDGEKSWRPSNQSEPIEACAPRTPPLAPPGKGGKTPTGFARRGGRGWSASAKPRMVKSHGDLRTKASQSK